MSYKSFILWVFIQAVLVCGGILGLLYIYDPLQLWHKPYFREAAFTDDTRVQDKGLITHYDFTHYILGSCMLQNNLPSEMQSSLGGKWVNLSMAGSTFDSRAVIMRYLQKQHPKHIIYSLDGYSLINPETSNTSSFDFLYDDNPYNDMKIYLNNRFLLCALSFSSSEICVGKRDLDTLMAWALNKQNEATLLFGGFKNWITYENDRVNETMDKLRSFDNTPYRISKKFFNIEKAKTYIQKHLLFFIKNNPDTEFSLIVLPYSLLHWRTISADDLAQWQQAIMYLVTEMQKFPNATIYGFDDLDYTADIANYMDPAHYNIDMNRKFIQAISNKTNIITTENVAHYLKIMENKIIHYDITPFANMAQKAAKEKHQSHNKK